MLVTLLIGVLQCFPAKTHAMPDYFFKRTTVLLDLEYEAEDENRVRPGSVDVDESTNTFRQGLEIKGGGWWYDPGLVTYTFKLFPEWRQQAIDASHEFSRDDDDQFFGYYLDAKFLSEKSQTLELHLSQSKDTFDSTLSPDIDTQTSLARLIWRLRDYTIPTIITVSSFETETDSFFRTKDDSKIFRLESEHKVAKSISNLNLEYEQQNRLIDTSNLLIDRAFLNLHNKYTVNDKIYLNSTLYSLDSNSEIFDTRSYSLSENLHVNHRVNLNSSYNLHYNQREDNGFMSDSVSAGAMLWHILYENLTTTVNLNTTQNDFTGGNFGTQQASLRFRYVRSIPAGRLGINNGYRYFISDNDIQTETSQVLDEVLAVVNTQPLLLDQSKIDVSSIVVTNNTASIIYIEGLDYIVSEIGASVFIEPTLFGGISDGETLLVDYIYTTQAPHKTDTRGVSFGARVDLWDKWSLYYDYDRNKENLISGTLPTDLQDDTRQVFGSVLKWGWSTTRAEFEDRDTIRAPLERLHISESIRFPVFQKTSFAFKAAYTKIDFMEEQITADTESLGLTASLSRPIGRWGFLEARAFSNELKGDSQNTKSRGISALLGWRYGDWRGRFRYQTLDENNHFNGQTRDRDIFTINVSRYFR